MIAGQVRGRGLMFVDFRNAWPPPEPPYPRPVRRVTPRAERVLSWIVIFNLVMLVVGPLAGVTLFDFLRAL